MVRLRSRRTDLRVLLLRGAADDAVTLAWTEVLGSLGMPYDEVVAGPNEPLGRGDLVHAGRSWHGRYHAVVLTVDSSMFWGRLDELQTYRARFGVRQVRGFEFPRPTVGLAAAEGRDVGGLTASLTPAGHAVFPALVGPVPIGPGTYGYPGGVLPGGITALVVDAAGRCLVGRMEKDGVEDLVLTLNYNGTMLHWRLLLPGLLAWVTRGVHWGRIRNNLTCHVDDVFLANWTTPEPTAYLDDGPPRVRMSPDDVRAVLDWQESEGFVLDLAYNGFGADVGDDLTAELLRHHEAFRWINHTWDHLDLGSAAENGGSRRWRTVEEIRERIVKNVSWAAEVDLEVDPTSLVTGAHSGLDNPNMSTALALAGVTTVAADASRQPEQSYLGSALTAPRHPTNIYTHVTTWQEQVSEYNRLTGANLGSKEAFLEAEASKLLARTISNDPRPIFAHQSNLTRDRVLLAVLTQVLRGYRSYVTDASPVESLSLAETAEELQRRSRWRSAVRSGQVSGWVGHGTVCVRTATDLDVPLTVPTGTRRRHGLCSNEFGQRYGGGSSAWQRVAGSQELRLRLPGRAAENGVRA